VLHLTAAVPAPGAGFPPALDAFFRRALAKRPDDRFASALELAAAFREATGVARSPSDLPRLDDAARVAWLADAPQPVAEAIASLDNARNAHQARDAARDVARGVVRYLMALALAARSQVRDGRDDERLHELLRALRRRDLQDVERVQLVRHLVRPFVARRGAHPIPELVDLVTPHDDDRDVLAGALEVLATGDPGTSEDQVRRQLARLVLALGRLLRAATPMLAYSLVVPAEGTVACWTGLRRRHRELAQAEGELVDQQPALIGCDGRVVLNAWPLVQCLAPSPGAEHELFVFDGVGRRGARLLASPMGFAHHDPAVWDWFESHVFGDTDEARELAEESRPYLGLFPFRTEDAERFVGREREIDGFINRLRSSPLQIVVGPSGAGKTSFVHAGVLPALPAGWAAVALRPGVSPMSSLAAALVAAGIASADDRTSIEGSPRAVVAHIAQAAAGRTIVIVVDQLEELFTLRSPAAEREQFASVLAALSASPEAATRIVCTVRDDFLMQVEALLPLRSLVMPAVFLLGNPSRDDLIRIVEEPARRAGYELSDAELASDMVAAVADRPGALALLSFTASRLWELRDRRFRQLSRRAYDAMGGVGGALYQHAEATLSALSSEDQRLVREAFRHLVTSDHTRAVLTIEELQQRMASDRAGVVIDKLVSARLITAREADGESHVELVHEALIAAWPRLQQWIREDADGARLHEQLRAAARQWHARGRANGLLWRGDALADLERWRRDRSPSLSELEGAFVNASRRAARNAQRLRQFIAFAALTVLVTAGFLYRGLQNRVTQKLAEVRVKQSYADQGRQALLNGKHGEALAYLAAASRRGDTTPSTAFMLARAVQPFLANRARLHARKGRMWSATFSPDGLRIGTTDESGARLWDADTYRLVAELPHDGTAGDGTFMPDSRHFVTAGQDRFIKVWDAITGKLVKVLTSDRNPSRYSEIAISPDGKLIAATDASGTVAHVWDASTGTLLAELFDTGRGTPAQAFSADSLWLATSGGSEVLVFDTRTWKLALRIAEPEIHALSFDPTGSRLATGSWRGDVSIWAIPSGERVHHLHETGDRINDVAYSPDGAFVAAASRDGAEYVWNTTIGALHLELKNHHGSVVSVNFDSSSKLVVSAGQDGIVAISDIVMGSPVSILEGPRSRVLAATFDPRSIRVIGASWDGVAWVWEVTQPYRRWTSPPIGTGCWLDLNLDGDQRFRAVGCEYNGTHVWDTARDQLLAVLPKSTGPGGDYRSTLPAISAAGDRAAIAVGHTAAIYALPGGRLLRTVTHPAAVSAIAFAKSGHDMVSGAVDGTLLYTTDDSDSLALPELSGGVEAIGFAPDSRLVVAGHRGRLRFHDLHRNTVIAERESPIRIRFLQFSADGLRLITTPPYGEPVSPVLWDLQHCRVIAQLEGHFAAVFVARFVDRDRSILTAGGDGTPKLFDSVIGRPTRTYLGYDQYLLEAVMDAEGETVIAGSGDGILRFWDAASGRMIWTLRAHRTSVAGIQVAGADIVTQGRTGEVSRWTIPRLPPAEVIDRAVRCLPLRLDEDTGGLEPQPPCDEP
jgi:WD40 repeat protein